MNKKMIGTIVLAIFAIIFTIWCFIDGIYYLGVFGFFIFIIQVCNYLFNKC